MSDTSFTTLGDEPVEARIVSWVLGEASAFEAAELERLCEERQELMIFKRRMLALHGLLEGAEIARPDDDKWKLPPEKRKAVDEILGAESVVRLEMEKEKRIRHNGRRALLAIAACLVLTVVVAGLMAPAGIQKARKTSGEHVESGSASAGQDHARYLHEFRKAVRDQEDKVEERSKVLATIERNKDRRQDSPREEAIKRGLDAQDFVDARRELESDKELLQKMKLKLMDEEISDRLSKAELASNTSSRRVQSLRTEIPPELIEGTPRPMNVPNLEAPADGPAGSSTWSMAERSRRGSEANEPAAKPEAPKSSMAKVVAATTAPATAVPVPDVDVTAPSIDFGVTDDFGAGFGGGGGEGAGHAAARPASAPAGAAEAEVDAFADNGPAARERETKTGSGTLSFYGGGVMPAEEPAESFTAGNRSGNITAGSRNNIDGILNGDVRSAGQKASNAEKQLELADTASVSEDVPVLGDLFSREQKSNLSFESDSSDYYDSSGSLSGANTYSGGTALGGGALGIGGFAGFASNTSPPPPAAPMPNESVLADGKDPVGGDPGKPIRSHSALTFERADKLDSSSETGEQAGKNRNAPDGILPSSRVVTEEVRYKIDDSDRRPAPGESDVDYWDTSKAFAKGKASGTDYERNTGYKNEYLFRGVDLAKDKAMIPDDAEALAKAVRDQEDKVEERRKVLATIVRNKGIIYKGNDSFYSQSGVDEDQGARNALQTYHEIEQEKLQLESQVSSLLKYDNDQLMIYAGGLDLPDNTIRDLYPKYQVAKRQLDELKAKGLGDRHPDVQANVDQVENMKRQLDEGVVNLRATLQAQLDLASNRLKSVAAMKNESREEAIKRGLEDASDKVESRREFERAKREFERDQALLQQMKLKLMRAKAEAPKPDITKLMEEIPAAEDPYSTFSLNISDASFQVAQAALAKGEQPDPAGIKVEQFYNAVDYGDPAPASKEPVAVNIEQSAHPVIPGRNLVRIALKTAAAGRSESQPLRLTLLVDQSGSMVREDRRAAMDKALAGLSELLTKNDLVTVIGFSRTPRLLADGMTGDKAGKLAELVNQSASEGGTNLEEAIKLGEQLADRRKLAGAQNRIVLFTDGAANLGNADPDRLAEQVKQLRQKGIAFDIAGIAADGLNDELLGELARNGNGRYYVVGKGADGNFAKQLAGAFRPAAENVKVQVRFNPERVGRYKLIGFEKDRLKTEDFRNDKVDAAELAAEEAGVAIYQVEPLPEGNGELGEVSVRFRDTARGEMVERTWTIPHDTSAPVLDRATPSMQLAVLSMLAGEKLKGGPLADAIDFKQFIESTVNVKQFYGNTGRIGDMLRVVDALK